MEIADVFYGVGIAFFTIFILLFITLGVLAWKAYQFLIKLPQEVQDRIETKVKSLIPSNKTQAMGFAGTIGTIAMPFILGKVKDMISRKKKRS